MGTQDEVSMFITDEDKLKLKSRLDVFGGFVTNRLPELLQFVNQIGVLSNV